MAKHRLNPKNQQMANKGEQPSEEKFQSLLKQQKYRQALEEIKRLQRSNPEIELTPKESSIWSLRGQQEFKQRNFKQAEKSFRRALELGLDGEAHYWSAKCLLALNQLDAALELLQTAFESNRLPKDYAGAYLKLLLLRGNTSTVEELLNKQAKRFWAAQVHWARGALALQAGQPETALFHFKKVKTKVTPDDVPTAWIAYTQQALKHWDAAATTLSLAASGRRSLLNHPVLKRLVVLQQAKTGNSMLDVVAHVQEENPIYYQEAVLVWETLQLIEQGNLHDAGHAFLQLNRRSSHFPELATLYRPLLTLAGQQAVSERQLDCAEGFWKPLVAQPPFDPHLAVNLLHVLAANSSDQERQRLLTRLLNWLEQEAKQNPQSWPDARLKPTLAKIHCFLADTWMALNRAQTALGSVRQAERLCPESPEVLGRRGLVAVFEENYQEATLLLTQALEGGCRFDEVYAGLLESWQQLGDKRKRDESRRRFGKHFGDVSVGLEVEVLPWIEALSTQSYPLFSVQLKEEQNDPAIRACKIFVAAVLGNPNSGGRVSLLQPVAVKQWEALLNPLPPEEQIPVLQAIILSLQLFAKREKGIAGLITQYLNRLLTLAEQYPAAQSAYLVMLVVKGSKPEQIQSPLRRYLDASTETGSTLAKIQQMVRRFAQTNTLVSFIDEALRREPQNPQLLLAKATTYPSDSIAYQELHQQGFELARRLQDAKALQAFREEQAFLDAREAQKLLPNLDRLDDLDAEAMEDFIENLIRKMIGKSVPPDELRRMMPELKKKMLEEMPGFDDFEPEAPGFALPFGKQGFKPKKAKRK
jgi:tetratricopeptide (TPR) repeat protein